MDSTPVLDVTCQQPKCHARVLARSTQAATDERARAGGWRIWDGPTEGGVARRLAVCPDCAKVPRPRKPDIQDYDQPLF